MVCSHDAAVPRHQPQPSGRQREVGALGKAQRKALGSPGACGAPHTRVLQLLCAHVRGHCAVPLPFLQLGPA